MFTNFFDVLESVDPTELDELRRCLESFPDLRFVTRTSLSALK